MSTSTEGGLHGPALRLVSVLVAAKRRLARHYLEWCVRGPVLEASTAITAMAQEEYGQARVLAGLLPREPAASEADQALPAQVMAPARSWIDLICLAVLFDTAITTLLAAGAAVCAPLERRAAKILQEERFHEVMAQQWFLLLSREPATRAPLLQQAWHLREQLLPWLEQLDRLLADMDGAARRSASLVEAWQQRIAPLLEQTNQSVGPAPEQPAL